jgi:phospholipase/carboxylesterase
MEIELDGPRLAPHAGGAPHCLVVICHGYGATGGLLIELGRAWAPALPHVAFAAPDAPFPHEDDAAGRQWWSLRDRSPGPMETGVRRAAPLLDAFVDAELVRLGLPPDAYALVGFSQGAMTVLFAGPRRPVAPRAIIGYAGMLIAPASLAAEHRNTAPVLLVHGEADSAVPAARSHEAEAAFAAAGIPVRAVYPPHLEHVIDAAGTATGLAFLRETLSPPGTA